ncbi:PREDICTED: actin-related protein T2-like [Crocodylus porosus]|uniref:Actin-related protein T2-like n=1 Tax=Crocodylus porosus TaxID=8502 RepID=A0A7M4DVS5_CROPO|nr:PREDICTED: actin-related protein T2-like [Crocodylus porosus]
MSDSRVLQTPAVIFDNGSGSCKAGVAGEPTPRSVVTSVIGHPKAKAAGAGQDYCLGEGALSKQAGLLLKYPIERGIVTSWDDMEKLWRHIYKQELGINPSERPVVMTEPPMNPLQNREKMTELLFECFKVPALYVSVQATLALYASARTTGLVMDSGDGVTHTVPIYEGHCLPHAVSRLNVAGRDITKYLVRLLSAGDHFFLSRGKRNVAKDIKEKFCYVALDWSQEMKRRPEEVLRDYKLPDGNTVRIGLHLCRAPEILFMPITLGIDTPGIHTMISNSIKKCDRDICHHLYGNVVLTGGSSLLQGLDERVFKEIEQQAPQGVPVRIVATPHRRCSAWMGASIISHLASFVSMWVTAGEYGEFGPPVVHRKCF